MYWLKTSLFNKRLSRMCNSFHRINTLNVVSQKCFHIFITCHDWDIVSLYSCTFCKCRNNIICFISRKFLVVNTQFMNNIFGCTNLYFEIIRDFSSLSLVVSILLVSNRFMRRIPCKHKIIRLFMKDFEQHSKKAIDSMYLFTFGVCHRWKSVVCSE